VEPPHVWIPLTFHAMTDITCAPLTGDRLADYLAFFDTRAFTDNPRWAGCYCYFPVHDPRQVEWEKRTAPENRADVAGGDLSLRRARHAAEADVIRRALRETDGNRTHAARLLGISHRALLYKLKEYEIRD